MLYSAKNKKLIVTFLGVLFIVASAVSGTFAWLYNVTKQNVLSKWQNDTAQFAQSVSHYFKMSEDAVAISAETLNDMLFTGKSNEEALTYLRNETEIYAAVISDNETGVYSFFRGEYLDGSGWIPDDDYEPKKRPWYTAAMESAGNIAFAHPYLNLQTQTLMISVSRLLDDGESVVSMDIFLDSIQAMAEKEAKRKNVKAVLVLNENGFVIAHSERSKVASFVEKPEIIKSQNDNQFTIKYDNKYCTVFSEKTANNWKTVFILENSGLYNSMSLIYIVASLIIILFSAASLLVFSSITQKYEEAEMLSREIRAIADIYEAVVKINLRKSSFDIIRKNELTDKLFPGTFSDFCENYREYVEKIAAEQSREITKSFVDFSTLEKRLCELKSVSNEFMDTKNRWIRLRFIVIDRDDMTNINNILLVAESIDEDKKQQETLRKRAETDMMTGIRNRGSGEALIRKAMAEGRKGMFCLLDADKFKSINDNFGHSVGDKVICAIAKCMEKTFRGSDIVFRLGGDEFAAFSEGVVSEEIGEKIIDRLFDNISKVDIPELEGRKISLSVGASFYPATREDSFEALYNRADSGTYVSKKSEGNAFTFQVQEK